MKAGTLESMKFKKLQRRLNETVRGTAGLLECIWQRATKDCPRGDIGRYSNLEIAIMGDWDRDADEMVEAMVLEKWFDESLEHRLLIHDWHEHAPNWLRGVVARKGGFLTIGSSGGGAISDASDDFSAKSLVANHSSELIAIEPSKPNLALPKPKPSPPPTPALSDDDVDAFFAEWEAVAVELSSEDVRLADKACDAARVRGCKPADVRRVLEFWRASRPAWNAGALYFRVLNLRCDEDHTSRWPAKSEEWQRLEQTKAAAAKLVKATESRATTQQMREANERESGRLEAGFGAQLDAMAKKEVREIVDANMPFMSQFVPKRGKVEGGLRLSLLSHLESTAKQRT